jgi:hypothetical protein
MLLLALAASTPAPPPEERAALAELFGSAGGRGWANATGTPTRRRAAAVDARLC